MTSHRRPTLNGPLLTVLVVGIAIAIALAIRILWPYPNVAVNGAVWFREMDGWYHMRLVDSLLANFPHTTPFDPYSSYPHGIEPPFHPLTRWLIALGAMLIGGTSPAAHTVDMVGGLYPAILGALTIVPVYLIARRLAGPVAAAIAAVVLATMPGEFLSRSLFGFTDHHMTEAFFSTLALLFLLLGTDAAAAGSVSLSSLRAGVTPAARRTLLCAALGGLSLGLYLVGWRGGLMVLAVILVYTVVRAVLDYVRNIAADDVVLVCSPAVAIAGIMVSPLIPTHWTPALYVAALLATALAPIALRLLNTAARSRHVSPRAYVAIICGIAALCLAAIGIVAPEVLRYALRALDFLLPTGASLTIMEMHPLLLPGGEFSLRVAWTNFVTVLPASVLALLVLWRSHRAPKGNHVTLFVVWSLCMLVAVLFQRRFGYYYAVNAAVLTGLLAAWVWRSDYVQTRIQSLGRSTRVVAVAGSKAARKALRANREERRGAVTLVAVLLVTFVAAILAPCVNMARNFAIEPGLMTRGWYETLGWLRDNTPDPLPEGSYYALIQPPPDGADFDYPDQAWSVMAWWDFGHWITRVSHRIPVANPFQSGVETASMYFLSGSEAEGIGVLGSRDSRYVVTDARTAVLAFHAVAAWGGHQRSDYYEVYSQRTSTSGLETIVLYYPEYYQSMLVRLQCFSGQSYQPDQFRVVTYEDGGGLPGADKLIVDLERFDTYEEAISFLQAGDSGHMRLVSSDPFDSCVPLETLASYTLAFESRETATLSGHQVPAVRVFEVAGI
ncbi:MAG: oligosaccharyl transferase, archaeosortase A system-associated [Dehalococcoidia bacterium]|jgi:dolichyl-diphosphooligosaccharide--protein glycosyltransferase|nr:oligosaccharyl transferase, archaeosortase A system-associated [Dehalococcoidia bacterium]